MALFNRKKVTDTPKEKQEAPEEFKEKISDAARSLKGLLFSKKLFDIQYDDASYSSLTDAEYQNLSTIYFDKGSKTMYKENIRLNTSKNRETLLIVQSLETLKLGENNEIAEYSNIESVHHYHPYEKDTYGEVKQLWNKEEGYITSKTERSSFMNEGENRVITDILENVVRREITNRKNLKTEKNQNR